MFENLSKPQGIRARYFSSIDSRDEAADSIVAVANGFLLLAAIQLVLGILFWRVAIVDALIYGTLAGLLWWLKSRFVAVLLALLASIALVSTLLNLIGITSEGGTNIVLAGFIFGAAVRAIQATWAYRRFTVGVLPPAATQSR